MINFKLIPYLEWYNVKKLSDSFEKKYYDEYNNLFSRYGFLNVYNDITDSFELIKTIVVLEGLNNKRKIENEAEIYTEVELSEENKHEVIHKKLPYFEFEDVKIYVPFFSKEFNVHYDTKLDSLTRPHFDSLKEDFDSSVINPFDTYGYKLFDSQFTRLVLIDEYKDEGVAVFYHIGFESIYIITDQGTCDAIIPIFDNNIKKKNKDKLFERISSLMKLYFANDREGFVDALLSLELISKHLYDLIQKNSDKKLVKKIKRIKTGKDLNV